MELKKNRLGKIFLALFVLQALINLVAVFGPELGFDALWYHLTDARLFLENRSINPIKGNLLYWSGLPRLGDLIYGLALKVWDERLTKLIHWFFGLLSARMIYLLACRQYNRLVGITAALLFYSTLLVGWLSTTSYIDLMAVAFLLMAIYARKWWGRGIGLILASAVKIQAAVYNVAITLIPWSLLGILPFAVVNLKTTGNPLYPFFEKFGFGKEYILNGFWYWFSRPLRLFFDPIYRVGPVILILFLLSFRIRNKKKLPILLVFMIWWLGPGTGFGRFALFLLALLSVKAASLLSVKKISSLVVMLIIVQAMIGIGGRAYGNQKYLKVILGKQTKADFLKQHLKFHFGDFYDIDGWFKDNIKSTDKVLIYNIHNLYYVDFPFDHQSWADSNQDYTHILVGDNQPLPEKHGDLSLQYTNPVTRVKLYKNE